MLEQSIKTLNNGDKVTGTVVAITPTEIQVDLGTKHSGYIPVSEPHRRPHRQGGGSGEGGRRGGGPSWVRVNDQEAWSPCPSAVWTWTSTGRRLRPPGRTRPSWRAWLPRTNKGGVVVSVKGIRGVRPRLSDRPAPGDSHEHPGQGEGPRHHHRGSTVPAAAWWAPSAASSALSAPPPLRRSGPRSRRASTTPAP